MLSGNKGLASGGLMFKREISCGHSRPAAKPRTDTITMAGPGPGGGLKRGLFFLFFYTTACRIGKYIYLTFT